MFFHKEGSDPLTLSKSQSSLTFATQNTGTTSAAQTFTISATGTGTETYTIIKSGTNPNDFSVSPAAGNLTGGAGNTTISVTFSPGNSGSRSAILTITLSGGATDTVSVSGTGQLASPPVSPPISPPPGPPVGPPFGT
jgi:hypothetical protein